MRAAVLGSPIAHSLSPVIHRAGYLAAGLTGWEYTAHEVDADALPGFVGGLDTSWRGLSLRCRSRRSRVRWPRRWMPWPPDRVPSTPWCDGPTEGGMRRTPTSSASSRRCGRTCPTERPERWCSGQCDRSVGRARHGRARHHHPHRAGPRHGQGGRPAELGARPRHPGIRNGSVADLGPWVSTRDDVVVSTLPATAAEAVAATVPAAHHGILLDVGYDGWPTPRRGPRPPPG